MAVVGVNSPAVTGGGGVVLLFLICCFQTNEQVGLNSSSALDQVEKEKTIAGKVE